MEERRKNKRLELVGEILIKELGSNNTETADIRITDCSSSGIGFKTTKKLTTGDIYQANLTIWTKEVLPVFIQIARSEAVGDEYHYGGVFIGMPEDVKKRIDVYETVEEVKEAQEHK